MNVDVSNFMVNYPDINDPLLLNNLGRQAEFYKLKLDKSESLKDKEGNYLKHQEMARRLINNETPYDAMIFEHDPGTGKTCIIPALQEWNKNENNKTPLIFVSNKTQKYNLIKLIANQCTGGRYTQNLFKEGEESTDVLFERRYRDAVKKDFSFEHRQKFATKLFEHTEGGMKIQGLTDEQIIKEYDGRLIIVDEAHHLRITGGTGNDERRIYDAFWRLTHVCKNIKLILLTGTLEADKAADFAYVMNLTLPEDEQLPTETAYNKLMFDSEDNLTEKGKKVLIEAVTGRISYLRASTGSETKLIEAGQTNPWTDYKKWEEDTGIEIEEDSYPWTRFTKVVPLKLSEFQKDVVLSSETRRDAYKNKEGDEREGGEGGAFHIHEKDANVFVWPNGLYGTEGFKAGVDIKTIGGKQNALGGTSKKMETYNIKPKFKEELKKNLGKYSAKFEQIVTIVKNAIISKGKVFIFSPDLSGGGLILLGLILNLMLGVSEVTEPSSNLTRISMKPRYMILSDKTTGGSGSKMTKLIEMYNDPLNARGEYVTVVMGTSVISEGITLYGIRHFISFKHDYRRTFVLQAEKRGLRVGSHMQLEPSERSIVIHRLVAADTDEEGNFLPTQTRDIKIFRQLENKDYRIRQQKRIRKEYAVDCVPFYARNVQENDVDFSQDCDNEMCNYVCAESPLQFINKESRVWKYEYPDNYLNFDNYNILYSRKEKNVILEKLRIMFQNNTEYSYTQIVNKLEEHNENLVMQTLVDILDNDVVMYTRYGTIAYMHENNGIFYIDNTISSSETFNPDGNQYIHNFYVESGRTLEDLYLMLEDQSSEEVINEFCSAGTDKERIDIVKSSNGKTLQLFVETFFLTLREGKKYSKEMMNFYNGFVYEMPDGPLVHVLETDNFTGNTYNINKKDLVITKKMRCLGKNNIWMYCSVTEEKKYNEVIKTGIKTTRADRFAEYSVYGIKNPKTDLFSLVRRENPTVLCLGKDDKFLIATVGQLNIKFPEQDTDDEKGVLSTYKDEVKNFDDVQKQNIIRLLTMSRVEACRILTTQIKEKMASLKEIEDTASKNLTLEEMTNLILDNDIEIIGTDKENYPSMLELLKLGYKGRVDLAPHTVRSLFYLYTLWNQKRNAVAKQFKKAIDAYVKLVNRYNNKYKKEATGIVCKTMNKKDMIRPILEISQRDDFPDKRMSREEMVSFILSNKTGFHEDELEEFDDETLNTIVAVFDSRLIKSKLCSFIYKRLEELNLLYDN